ncbi:hypothetical protein NK718_06005 [Alsobacter sp. SYSU M60028]|uniref:Uncharacterized protein n=1 Tax=Alsobacter ponti TaxID=2962936 RepID=A0ABT1L989_9HYPH|nr:hypothetical protein [Alsobacter ponti]MCP8938062.1 hypothetical protein [Alsobacter ponti]
MPLHPAPLAAACLLAACAAASAQNPPPSPEIEACRASGLVALQEKSPSVKDITFDVEGLTVAKADTRVEDTPIRTVVMGEAYLQRDKSDKAYQFVCLIGDKGKVVLTFFTQR